MNATAELKAAPVATIAVASLLLMAALDFVTGQELVFSCAYLIPVSITAWHFGRNWMAAMASASGLAALLVDHFDGYSHSSPGIEYWNAFTCFGISIATGHVLCRLKQSSEAKTAANAELSAALGELKASTAEIRELQESLQIVCSWTKKIKVGDRWVTPDEFLSEKMHLKLSHGISPEAFRDLLTNLPSAA